MAIPLKNGADLYNFEVLRMRFHNLGADPTSDFGVGQVYFNTSTSEGSGKRVRIYDGSAFRSLAYFDEIDNRLKLLEGEIDTDAIISNMKEVSAFLEGFAEDASLMDVLNGKLDKTGGTMSLASISSFMINRTDAGSPAIGFSSNGLYWGSIGFSSNGVPVFYDGAQVKYNFIHSGNVGEYALKIDGSNTITGDNGLRWLSDLDFDILRMGLRTYKSTKGTSVDGLLSSSYGTVLQVGVNDPKYAFQLVSSVNADGLYYRGYYASGNDWSAWKTIAFTDSNVASAQALVHSNRTVGATVDANGNVSFNGAGVIQIDGNEVIGKHSSFYIGYQTAVKDGLATKIWGKGFQFSNEAGTHRMIINESGNVTIGATDLAGTDYKLCVHGNTKFLSDANNYKLYTCISQSGIQVGRTTANYTGGYNGGLTYGEDDTTLGYIAGVFNDKDTDNTHFFYGGPAGSAVLNIKNSNVLIGTTKDDGLHKLQVTGGILASRALSVGSFLNINRNALSGSLFDSTKMAVEIEAYSTHVSFKAFDTTNTRVGHIEIDASGDVHIPGNLIVDGEVSAGGAGEEGDTGTGTGGGDALIYSQEFTPTTTSITITHNLSATKGVIVQVWEKNGNYWDMVLVDVEEVDTNTVILFFGKTETTVHKVVIMG